MKHPFFASIEWETLKQQEPYWIPQIDDPTDTSYFEGFVRLSVFFEVKFLFSLAAQAVRHPSMGMSTPTQSGKGPATLTTVDSDALSSNQQNDSRHTPDPALPERFNFFKKS